MKATRTGSTCSPSFSSMYAQKEMHRCASRSAHQTAGASELLPFLSKTRAAVWEAVDILILFWIVVRWSADVFLGPRLHLSLQGWSPGVLVTTTPSDIGALRLSLSQRQLGYCCYMAELSLRVRTCVA